MQRRLMRSKVRSSSRASAAAAAAAASVAAVAVAEGGDRSAAPGSRSPRTAAWRGAAGLARTASPAGGGGTGSQALPMA